MKFMRLLILTGVLAAATAAAADEHENWSGQQIMQAVQVRQQQFPFVYEEQSIVLVDRNGFRDTRKARRYSRIEDDGSIRFLLIFETPPEVRGVALLASRDPAGVITKQMYLPALGQQLLASAADDQGGGFMGTDFTVENLTGEALAEYRYVRSDDLELDSRPYFSVDVFRPQDDLNRDQPLRRHFIRQDNFFITRTDHFDAQGRVTRRQRSYDLKVVDGNLWHANLLLMDDYRERHQTLIKVDRRVFSRDYVPAEMFSGAWLFEHYRAEPQENPDTPEAAASADSGGRNL